MEESVLQERIARARQLLATIRHIPLATVNEDGLPHNSPLFMAFDGNLHAYWASHTETQHSQNIARDGNVFLVVFDSREGHGGLYIRARATSLETAAEAQDGYELLKAEKEKLYGTMGELRGYIGDGPQRIYRAEPLQLWVNKSERDASGAIIRDSRYEITPDQLQ